MARGEVPRVSILGTREDAEHLVQIGAPESLRAG
jgi:hypothetical protein